MCSSSAIQLLKQEVDRLKQLLASSESQNAARAAAQEKVAAKEAALSFRKAQIDSSKRSCEEKTPSLGGGWFKATKEADLAAMTTHLQHLKEEVGELRRVKKRQELEKVGLAVRQKRHGEELGVRDAEIGELRGMIEAMKQQLGHTIEANTRETASILPDGEFRTANGRTAGFGRVQRQQSNYSEGSSL